MMEIKMPDLGQTTDELTLVRWWKQEGETVKHGETLFEVETDKATTEVEAFSDGVVGKLLFEAGATVRAGEVIAILLQPGEQLPNLDEARELPEKPAVEPAPQEPLPDRTSASADSPRPRLSPKARRLAESEGAPPAHKVVPLTNVQRTAAIRLSKSKDSTPHFYMSVEVDMEAVAKHRATLQAGSEVKLTYTSFFVKAAADTLQDYPMLNSSFLEGYQVELHEDVNVGVAVATERGLMVPVVRNANRKPLLEIAAQLAELADRARTGRLTEGDLKGGTFTVSNAGMYGVLQFAAIINPPEAAIMAVGGLTNRPVITPEGVVAHRTCVVTLSADHRVADGAMVASFLSQFKNLLENPDKLR